MTRNLRPAGEKRLLCTRAVYGAVRVLLLAVLVYAWVTLSGQAASGQQKQIVVTHVHDSGWTSHQIGLELTPKTLRLNGPQVFRGSGGLPATCKFPPEIPLEDILSAEYKFQRVSLKMFTTLDNSSNIGLLNLEYRDERGKQHSITLIPGDARQNYNAWTGGNGDALEAFAGAIQNAMNARNAELKQAANPSETFEDSSAPEQAGSENPQPRELVDTSGPFHVQMAWPEYTRQVDVYPSMPGDPPRVLVRDNENGTSLVDVSLDDISNLEMKKREVKLTSPVKYHSGVIRIGPAPKVYELCWKLTVNGAASQNCFIPPSANCQPGSACTVGDDSESSVFRLEKAMRAVMDARGAHLARVNAQPPSLDVHVTFDDSKSFAPDQQLDAGKSAEFEIEVRNAGPGPAYGVMLDSSCEDVHVNVPASLAVGDIAPGQSRTVRMPISAGLDIQDGKVRLRVQARDTRNFSSAPVGVDLTAMRLVPPSLEIEDSTFDAQPTSGSVVRMNVYIRNSGAGPAIHPVLTISNLPAELNADHSTQILETIAPGRTESASIAFSIPRTWSGAKLEFRLSVFDARGEAVGAASRDFMREAVVRAPALNAAVRVLSTDSGSTTLANGETARIEITPRNEGELESTGVRIRVTAEGAAVDPSLIDVGVVPPHLDQNSRQVTLKIPRGYRLAQLPLKIELQQSEFPSRVLSQQLPVNVHTPHLRIEPFIEGASRRLAVEQNQSARLGVRIANDGDLAAENVVVRLGLNVAGINLSGPSEIRLGIVQAHSMAQDLQFPLKVYSSASAGVSQASLSVEQSDFDGISVPFSIEVLPQSEVVQQIAPARVDTGATARGNERSHPVVVPLVAEEIVHSDTVELRATVEDAHEIREIAIEVNDSPLSKNVVSEGVMRSRTGQGAELDTLRVTIPLSMGINRLLIKAINVDNESETAEVTVTRLEGGADPTQEGSFKAMSDVDQFILAATPTTQDPSRWAVAIGIEKYWNHSLPDATYSERDAQAMKEYFVRILGVPERQVIVLLDSQATKTVIDGLLEDDLPSRIKNASQVFFYFSGHGHPGGVGQDSYLVPYDGNVHSLVRSGISIRKLYQELSKLDAQNKMVFLDACFSGNTARGGHVDPLIAGSKPAYIEITLPVEPSLVSLTAAAANQESNAYPAKFHSLFTYFVLRDLQNRPANISELSSRVIRDVENQIGEMFGNAQTQTPVLVTATDVDKTAPLVKR